jgi:hypothetical protein
MSEKIVKYCDISGCKESIAGEASGWGSEVLWIQPYTSTTIDLCPNHLAAIRDYIAAKCPELGKPAEASGEPVGFTNEEQLRHKTFFWSYTNADHPIALYRHPAPARVAALEKLADAVRTWFANRATEANASSHLDVAWVAFEKSQAAPAEDWRSKCEITVNHAGRYGVRCGKPSGEIDTWLQTSGMWQKTYGSSHVFETHTAAANALAAAAPPPRGMVG